MEHSTEILYNKTEVYCSTVHRFGSDALLLARFCEPRRSQKAAEAASENGEEIVRTAEEQKYEEDMVEYRAAQTAHDKNVPLRILASR